MRRTIIGLDLDREFSQISYFSERSKEPETMQVGEEQNHYLIPTPSDLFTITEQAMDLGVMTLANFIRSCLALLRMQLDLPEVYMMVTMREIKAPWIDAVKNACEMIGMDKEHVYLQTHRESFFAYVLHQRKDLWAHEVALFEYEEDRILSYVMEINYETKPALVTVSPGEILQLGWKGSRSEEEWNAYRDERFLDMIRETFDNGDFSSTFLIGDSFDKTWAVSSLQYLCRKRRVFQGRNLYTKGACYAACHRVGVSNVLDRFLYKSEDMIEINLSMQMITRQKPSNYLLIGAGANWYEAEHTCEILLDDEREILMYGKSMLGGEVSSYTIPLKRLPQRPPRTTRLQLTAKCLSASECKVTIRDLGFGDFFKASGLVWESILTLE